MEFFIQPSNPFNKIEKWDAPEINDLFPANENVDPNTNLTVYEFLKTEQGIGWDWSTKRKLAPGDKIFIYFSKNISRIWCLTEVETIRVVENRARPLVAYLKKIYWLNDEESQKLSYADLRNNGLKNNLPRLTNITNNFELMNYIQSIVHL
ncbi:MAG: hypothetical protein CVV22_05325 [Ignavibacteriae bacterium HGW-Ignavibacteriae-1]|jgi:hypothetical protein|nr:MAG: hypothetical protein CVV22_05325 [Ignavibacteriae bacterium HGW-Ignavibacteriae-1]